MTTNPSPSDPRNQQWPESPPGGHQMPAAPTRPTPVEVSFWLWAVYLALDAVAGGVFLLTQGSVVTREQIAMFVVALLVDAAMLVFAFLMREGRNWARIVLAVLGSLRLLLLLFVLIVGGNVMFAALLVLVGAATGTTFLPAANVWFRPRQPGL
jgi:hypothetical protein